MARTIALKSWAAFERQLTRLAAERTEMKQVSSGSYIPRLLFRGHSNARWKLHTTLERHTSKVNTWREYLRLAALARHPIESLTGKRWQSPFDDDVEGFCQGKNPLRPPPAYSYLIYLRHHGFPSPLLDWSLSPYVAAYFAFAPAGRQRRAIYAFLSETGSGREGMRSKAEIDTFGDTVTSHARHVLQQCQYSACYRFTDEERVIADHEEVFARGHPQQDLLWKFTLPASERIPALRKLDAYNLNAFSLFQSDDSLLETMALRSIDFAD